MYKKAVDSKGLKANIANSARAINIKRLFLLIFLVFIFTLVFHTKFAHMLACLLIYIHTHTHAISLQYQISSDVNYAYMSITFSLSLSLTQCMSKIFVMIKVITKGEKTTKNRVKKLLINF